MPNRIIKESICYSDDLDKLSAFEETVFYRLIVRADDYGRMDARPGFLKSMLFATKQGITERNISEAVSKLASIGLVRLYEVDGKPFLLFPKWNLHQRVRNSKEKYPAPPESWDFDNSPQVAASCGEFPQVAALIQSNPNPNPNPILQPGAKAPGGDAVIELPLNDKTMYGVPAADVASWKELYPAVNVEQELKSMLGWLMANPKKRKTRQGINKFINGWLTKRQDRGGTIAGKTEEPRRYREL